MSLSEEVFENNSLEGTLNVRYLIGELEIIL